MQGYGTLADRGQEQPGRRGRDVSRAVLGAAALALIALVGVVQHMHSAAPVEMPGKDLNTYSDWLKTLNGPASYTGIGDETSDFGASQHNSKKGMRELVPGALPADAKIAQMQGADFVDDVVCAQSSLCHQQPSVQPFVLRCMCFQAYMGFGTALVVSGNRALVRVRQKQTPVLRTGLYVKRTGVCPEGRGICQEDRLYTYTTSSLLQP